MSSAFIAFVFTAAYYAVTILLVRKVRIRTKDLCICSIIIAMTLVLESIWIPLPTGAALPCMLSYGWIFQEMLRRSPEVQNTVYGRFVCDYADDSYDKLCDEWIEFAEKACAGLNAGGKQRCLEIFRACSEHELHFWEMSALPRQDLR